MNIGKITPQMLRDMPDQVCATINRLIEKVNELERNK